jgi:hypothetical protein
LTFATSGLAVPLALSTAVALGAGDLEMTLEMGEQTWEAPGNPGEHGEHSSCLMVKSCNVGFV